MRFAFSRFDALPDGPGRGGYPYRFFLFAAFAFFGFVRFMRVGER